MRGPENGRTLTFPNTIERVQNRAFRDARLLQAVVLNGDMETLDESAFCDSNVRVVMLPATLTEIEKYAFSGCQRLRRVTFGQEGLQECRPGEVALPAALKRWATARSTTAA